MTRGGCKKEIVSFVRNFNLLYILQKHFFVHYVLLCRIGSKIREGPSKSTVIPTTPTLLIRFIQVSLNRPTKTVQKELNLNSDNENIVTGHKK